MMFIARRGYEWLVVEWRGQRLYTIGSYTTQEEAQMHLERLRHMDRLVDMKRLLDDDDVPLAERGFGVE